MANIKSAQKRIRVTANKTAQNRRVKTRIKEIIRSFDDAVKEGNKDSAKENLLLAEKKLKRAMAHNVFKKNTISRKISNLTRTYNKMSSNEVDAEPVTAPEKPILEEENKVITE